MRILYPLPLAGRCGLVQVPLWTFEEGDRRIGVLLDGGRMEWVTAVEVIRTERVRVDLY